MSIYLIDVRLNRAPTCEEVDLLSLDVHDDGLFDEHSRQALCSVEAPSFDKAVELVTKQVGEIDGLAIEWLEEASL